MARESQLEQLVQSFKDTSYNSRKLMINGFVTMGVGIYLLYAGVVGSQHIIDLMSLYIFVLGAYNLVSRFFKPREDRTSISHSLLQMLLGIMIGILNEFTTVPVQIIVIIFGVYQFFVGSIHLITWWLYRKDGISHRGRYLFDAIVYLVIGSSAMTDSVNDSELQFFIFGVYLFFLGFTYFRDGWFFDRENNGEKLRRHRRMNLPIVLVALLPNSVLRKINETLQIADEESVSLTAAQLYNQAKLNEAPDLEIFIHVTETGFGAMGHVDICYEGRVISYGCYDTFSEKLGGAIGDGVLFKVDRQKYIDFCKVESGKTLFGYGLRLNEAQRKAVEQRLADIDALIYPWEPSDKPVNPDDEHPQPMYAYRLKQETGASLFKFKESKFKTYFVMSTNCVLLADSIIGQAGTDILSMQGIITPGTYQDYLEREYAKPHSIVITRSVY